MILESGNDFAALLSRKVRVCIIGAGAAGISLACELDGCGFEVRLFEAGARANHVGDFYEGSATPPHPEPRQFRRVGFGGTTAVWGGRCVPFDPIDFERREYLANTGWPITYDEVARFYPAAMEYCDAGRFDFLTRTSLPGAEAIIRGFKGDEVVDADHIERYSLPTDFGRRYRRQLQKSANVTVMLGLRCLKLNRASGADMIESAEFIDQGGHLHTVRADTFVLATVASKSRDFCWLPTVQGVVSATWATVWAGSICATLRTRWAESSPTIVPSRFASKGRTTASIAAAR